MNGLIEGGCAAPGPAVIKDPGMMEQFLNEFDHARARLRTKINDLCEVVERLRGAEPQAENCKTPGGNDSLLGRAESGIGCLNDLINELEANIKSLDSSI